MIWALFISEKASFPSSLMHCSQKLKLELIIKEDKELLAFRWMGISWMESLFLPCSKIVQINRLLVPFLSFSLSFCQRLKRVVFESEESFKFYLSSHLSLCCCCCWWKTLLIIFQNYVKGTDFSLSIILI